MWIHGKEIARLAMRSRCSLQASVAINVMVLIYGLSVQLVIVAEKCGCRILIDALLATWTEKEFAEYADSLKGSGTQRIALTIPATETT